MKKILVSTMALVLMLTVLTSCSSFMKGFKEGLEKTAADFDTDFTVDDYIAIIVENMKTNIGDAECSEVKDAMIGIGGTLSAKQFEISGSVDKIKAKYFVTCFKSGGVFYQVMAWSLQTKYGEAKVVFDTILESVLV